MWDLLALQADTPCFPPVLQNPAAGLSSWVDLCTFEGFGFNSSQVPGSVSCCQNR